jgi:hypothetical protein
VPSPAAKTSPPAVPVKRRRRPLRTALVLILFFVAANELTISCRANRLSAEVPTAELEAVGRLWNRYDSLTAGSLRIGGSALQRALVEQTVTVTDRVIGNYRTPVPTVREAQWRMAREALAHACAAAPRNRQLEAALRYCDGHLHRIDGEARKARHQNTQAQYEFTEAVSAFREAAELRPGWPDPFLGLMRTFIYGLEDVDRGADALSQAERLGYTAGDRETVQLGDGYRTRATALARSARAVAGMPQERDYLTRSADAYRRAIDLYSKALGYGDVPRSMRAAQRGLAQVEQRLAELSNPVESFGPPWP